MLYVFRGLHCSFTLLSCCIGVLFLFFHNVYLIMPVPALFRYCVAHVFFFKQKTEYEMRIIYWSSDVCSSDLYTSVLYGSPKSDPNSTLWSSGSIEYQWNSGLDSNGDGRVTAGEASDAVRGRVDGNIDEGGSTVPDKPSDPGDGGDTGSNPGNGASYTVRSGDTLSGIAAANNMSLDALISANPQISNPNLISPGDR